MSLRLLIKEDVMKNGLVDVTCRLLEGMGTEPPRQRRARRSGADGYLAQYGRQDRAETGSDEEPGYEPSVRPARSGKAVRQKTEPAASQPVIPRESGEPGREAAAGRTATRREADASKQEGAPRGQEEPVSQPLQERTEPKPVEARPPQPPSDMGDPMAFLNRTAGAADGMLGMLGMDEDDEE